MRSFRLILSNFDLFAVSLLVDIVQSVEQRLLLRGFNLFLLSVSLADLIGLHINILASELQGLHKLNMASTEA